MSTWGQCWLERLRGVQLLMIGLVTLRRTVRPKETDCLIVRKVNGVELMLGVPKDELADFLVHDAPHSTCLTNSQGHEFINVRCDSQQPCLCLDAYFRHGHGMVRPMGGVVRKKYFSPSHTFKGFQSFLYFGDSCEVKLVPTVRIAEL